MDIKNLERYLKICRKYGVEELKIGENQFKLSKDPPESRYKQKQNESNLIETKPQYSDIQMLMWSAGGVSGEEVENG